MTPSHADDIVDLLDGLVARSMVVPVDEGDETRFRLLEPVRQLAAEQLAARGETEAARDAHTQWYLDLLVRLGERWRAGDDQGSWPIAARELPNLQAAFDRLVDTERIDDAQRFAAAGFGPVNNHFDNAPTFDWAPRAASLDLDHVGPYTASVCAVAAWGPLAQGDLDGAAAWIRRSAEAIERGSQDDGLVVATALSHVFFGGRLAVSEAFLQRSVDEAMRSDDLHRQVWVPTYTRPADEAIAAASRLGNQVLLAFARWSAVTPSPSARSRGGRRSRRSGRPRSVPTASSMRNHAAHLLGAAHVRAGGAVDGLLLLRAPARDWLLRGDMRVWDVLHTVATGLAASGDVAGAARLVGAIGDRHLTFVPDRERQQLQSLLEAGLGDAERARHERAGRELDLGRAVAEALERIEVLATSRAPTRPRTPTLATLTARQRDVAALVARGMTNKQIAQRLGISRFTAETHVRNILDRLGAASRSEIATWATRQPVS